MPMFASFESFLGWACLLFGGLIVAFGYAISSIVESVSNSEVASKVVETVAEEVGKSWLEKLLEDWFK